eukprot:gene7020-9601_t
MSSNKKGRYDDIPDIIPQELKETPASFFITNAVINTILPLFLFKTVLLLDIFSNIIIVAIFSALAIAALQHAYRAVAKKLISPIAKNRRDALQKIAIAERKAMKTKGSLDVDTMRVQKEQEVALYESRYLSVAFVTAAQAQNKTSAITSSAGI